MKEIKYPAKRAFIVIGLGYGDEGKGLTTDYLCEQNSMAIVVRFNGGQQAGHTVVNEKSRYVFSNFGSGTLRGIPTYWSKFCTFSPIHFLEEYEKLPLPPKFYLDRNSQLTTHYDILFSRAVENSRGPSRHGSCGVGFGATIDRAVDEDLVFKAVDMSDIEGCIRKLKLIRIYYQNKFKYQTIYDFTQFDHDKQDEEFIDDIRLLNKLSNSGKIFISDEREIFRSQEWRSYIFEGAQGILLDQNFGERPHITKSNTTSKNAIDLLEKYFRPNELKIEIFYVTRAYLTRHGAGPLNDSFGSPLLKNTDDETNVENEFQGKLRTTFLELEQMKAALAFDRHFSRERVKHLIVTCMDQIYTQSIPIVVNSEIKQIIPCELQKYLEIKFKTIKVGYGPSAANLCDVTQSD